MGAPSISVRDSDTLSLLDYGFSLYRRERPVRSGEKLGSAHVPNADTNVALEARRGLTTTVRRGQTVDVALHAPRSLRAPIHRGERVGAATASLAGRPVGRVPVVAARGVKPAGGGSVLADLDDAVPGPRIVVWIVGVGLLAVLVLIGTSLARRNPNEGRPVH
jgi:D-alanyl-D-alanine carboxypeptidase (penicillin-binding protein 5/6)